MFTFQALYCNISILWNLTRSLYRSSEGNVVFLLHDVQKMREDENNFRFLEMTESFSGDLQQTKHFRQISQTHHCWSYRPLSKQKSSNVSISTSHFWSIQRRRRLRRLYVSLQEISVRQLWRCFRENNVVLLKILRNLFILRVQFKKSYMARPFPSSATTFIYVFSDRI